MNHGPYANHNKHEGHTVNMFRDRFWWSLILSIPVVLYSPMVQGWFRFTMPDFPGSLWLPLILGTIIFFYGGMVFVKSAVGELKDRQPGMMTLISLAISVAFLYSLYATVAGSGDALWWELATLITIMLLGHWLEMRAVMGAQGALRELAKLLPDTAEIIRNNQIQTVPLEQLRVGDVFFVKPGGKVAADGKIVEGKSEIDESMITGESKPAGKSVNDEVIAGTINGDGSLTVQVTKIGEQTFLAGVMRLVKEAQTSKSKLQILSDRAAFYLTIIALFSGAVTFILWAANGAGANFALQRTVAVLVIACPHALGLAIPLVASISTNLAAKNGLLVKQRLALESARRVDVVLFDKTGTLTKGEYGVSAIMVSSGSSYAQILQIAASVNTSSEHPIARALLAEAKKKQIPLLPTQNFKRMPGKGVSAEIEGKKILVGSETLLADVKISAGNLAQDQIKLSEAQGKTIIFIISENQLLGSIALADIIREESRQAVKQLQNLRIKVSMITGDSQEVAKWVAGELNIKEYFAQVLPEEKANKVKLLQAKGYKVAMVGDGINDAPALTQADLGIAIGAGTNVAVESAGIILVKNDPRDIPKVIELSKLTYVKMMQNLFWATGYNIVALPLAAGVLAFKGILLQPALAAVFMTLSTIMVAANALMLKRIKLTA